MSEDRDNQAMAARAFVAETKLEFHELKIAARDRSIDALTARIAELTAEVDTLRRLAKELDAEIGSGDRKIADLNGQLADRDRRIADLARQRSEAITDLVTADRKIAALREQVPRETSASIAVWQRETFGPATTTLERIRRSDEAIFSALWRAKNADLSIARPNLSRAIRAGEELAELIYLLVERDDDPRSGMEVADVQIVLAGITAAHGQEQSSLVDEKMKINRARTWRTTGDGHGQHVEKEQG